MRTYLAILALSALVFAGCQQPEAPKGGSKSAQASYQRKMRVYNAAQGAQAEAHRKLSELEGTVRKLGARAVEKKDEVMKEIGETRSTLNETAASMAAVAELLQQNTEQVTGTISKLGQGYSSPTPAPSPAPQFR